MPVPNKIGADRTFFDSCDPVFWCSGDIEYLVVKRLASSFMGGNSRAVVLVRRLERQWLPI